MFARIFLAIFLSLTGLTVLAPASEAQSQSRRERADDGVQPLDRLLPSIRRSHPGEFYDAEGPTYGPSGQARYHLKWMTPDGRIIWLEADARSGRVLGSSPGRERFDDRRVWRRETPRSFDDRRYGPYTGEPYDGGYGRARQRERERYAPNFAPRPRYGNPYREGRGRWRRDR